ncbi:unnamed protein product, partial [Dovyalis caffra]
EKGRALHIVASEVLPRELDHRSCIAIRYPAISRREFSLSPISPALSVQVAGGVYQGRRNEKEEQSRHDKHNKKDWNMGCKKTRTKKNKGVDAQLSFPKCRSSASKAVNEVQTLCAVETLLIMLSLGGNQSSLCHHCVDAIMKRLADPGNSEFDTHMAEHEAMLGNLNKQYCDILKQLEAQKLRGKELEELEKVTHGNSLLDAPIDDLNLQELEILQKSLGELKENLLKQIEKVSVHTENPPSSSANFAGVVNPSMTNPAGGCSSADVDDHDDGHGH